MTSPLADKAAHKHTDCPNANQSNWYAKLHPIGMLKQTKVPKRPLNLSIFFRIWLAVALIIVICGTIVFSHLYRYVKPTVQQVMENTLSDTSSLLAASLQLPLQSGELYNKVYQKRLDNAFNTDAVVTSDVKSDKERREGHFRVYVTDKHGTVIYDSLPAPNNAEGKNYSHRNALYLAKDPAYGINHYFSDDVSSNGNIMYVAQPIKDAQNRSIGVVSVGKPMASVVPYLETTRKRMLSTAILISIIALLLAGLVAWWLKQSITLVTHYTSALAEDSKKPYFYLGLELNGLTDTIEAMKHRLEDRAYVSDYVHTLTHELKSPLTAIRASSELLEDHTIDVEDRQILVKTVGEQSIKIQQLIDRLLLLAKVEQPTFKLNRQLIPLLPLLRTLIKDNSAKLQQRHLPPIDVMIGEVSITDDASVNATTLTDAHVYVDRFWFIQALQNVLDNAIYFADNLVAIHVHETLYETTIDIFNDGKLLPDYALTKVFDRYFSLSHRALLSSGSTYENPHVDVSNGSQKKGTGLGLTLVKQVIEHHGGQVSIVNSIKSNHPSDAVFPLPNGVVVSISLPCTHHKKTR